jgi:hypothetical protein
MKEVSSAPLRNWNDGILGFYFLWLKNMVINGINDLCSVLHHIFATILRPCFLHIGYNS